MFHLSRVLQRAIALYGHRTALSDDWSTLTYRQLGERVAGLAAGLRARVRPGDRVALLDRNSLRVLEVNFACAALGAVLMPLNTRLAAPEIAEIVAETSPRLFFAAASLAHLIPATVEAIVWPDDDPAGASNAYESLIVPHTELPAREASENEIAQIFYTSGTTGAPKGVCLTHQNLVASAYDAIVALALDRDDVWLHAAPMFHLVDAFAIWGMTLVGGLHAVAHFRPDRFAETIAKHAVTKTSLPPTLIALALDGLAAGDARLRSLARVSYGGSPMTEAVHARATDVLGIDLLQAYGITEVSGIVAHQLPGDYVRGGSAEQRARLNAAGQAVTSVRLRLVGDEGNPVSTGIGEIHAAGPRVMAGYWNRPDATRAALDGGWYRTGDLGSYDRDGHLFIVGRKKDMMITGGENVYPVEVENALAAHPAVDQVAVFGVPSERWGEEVRAVVVLRANRSASEAELLAFCRERIGSYKVPKAVTFHRGPLPTTGPGKIAKHLLRDEAVRA